MRIIYVGKNGLDYGNAIDAATYGGGLSHRRTDMGIIEEKVKLTRAEIEEVQKKLDATAGIRYELTGSFDAVDDTEEVDVPDTEEPIEEIEEVVKLPKKKAARKKTGQKKKSA